MKGKAHLLIVPKGYKRREEHPKQFIRRFFLRLSEAIYLQNQISVALCEGIYTIILQRNAPISSVVISYHLQSGVIFTSITGALCIG